MVFHRMSLIKHLSSILQILGATKRNSDKIVGTHRGVTRSSLLFNEYEGHSCYHTRNCWKQRSMTLSFVYEEITVTEKQIAFNKPSLRQHAIKINVRVREP